MLWTTGGKLIVDNSGRPIECPDCPCDDVPPGGSCAGCTGTAPDTFLVDNPTLSNQTCSGCTLANLLVNRTLTRVDNPTDPFVVCQWKGPLFNICEDNEGQWILEYIDNGIDPAHWRLTLADTNSGPWTLNGSQSCQSTMTLSGGGGGSECSGYPSSIGVAPA